MLLAFGAKSSRDRSRSQDELKMADDGQWYVHGVVRKVEPDVIEVWIRGSFFTTNGLASVPRRLAMAA